MKWTKEKPSEPGMYVWKRKSGRVSVWVATVFLCDGELMINYNNSIPTCNLSEVEDREWLKVM